MQSSAGCLTSLKPSGKGRMPTAVHVVGIKTVTSLPSQSRKSTIQLFTGCQSTGLTGFLKKVTELTWTELCQLRQGLSLKLSKTGAIPVGCGG